MKMTTTQSHAVRQRAENLGAIVSERLVGARRPLRHPQREQAEPERGHIGEHVEGIRQQRQTVGQPPADELDDAKQRGEAERQVQHAAVIRAFVHRDRLRSRLRAAV
jgi:hypothetical protein